MAQKKYLYWVVLDTHILWHTYILCILCVCNTPWDSSFWNTQIFFHYWVNELQDANLLHGTKQAIMKAQATSSGVAKLSTTTSITPRFVLSRYVSSTTSPSQRGKFASDDPGRMDHEGKVGQKKMWKARPGNSESRCKSASALPFEVTSEERNQIGRSHVGTTPRGLSRRVRFEFTVKYLSYSLHLS